MTDNKKPVVLGGAIGTAVGAAIMGFVARRLWRRPSDWLPPSGDPPHPDWKVGENQPPPFSGEEMMALDPSELGGARAYPLVISAVVPRPIAFVCTLSAAGVRNLAPFSYFGAMSHDPPHVCIGICRSRSKATGKKDTLANILATKEFTLNMMSEWFVESANHTCGEFDDDVDELSLAGLTPLPSLKVAPPRVKESSVHLECKLVHTYEVRNEYGVVTATIVIGRVVMFHVHKEVAGKTPSGNVIVDFQRYKPVSRLGGNTYGRTAGTFDLPRPDRKIA
uniref:Flavo protein oxygenase n=1 Tax=Tetraselmis sp. GSL018 TaxID=582737 RepID=A0A061SEF3_9CHLO